MPALGAAFLAPMRVAAGAPFPSRPPSPIQQALGKRESQLASVGLAFGVRKVCQCAFVFAMPPICPKKY
jgi:hypothetical protein